MQQEKEQVALTSIAASAALTIAKGLVGFATGSLAILSEAGHSLIDLGATVMTYAAVRVSGKPADEEHQYGHGKFESVSALAETALLFLLSGVVIWEAVKRLTEHEAHAVDANAWAFGVIAVSIVVDFFRSRALRAPPKQTQSQALEADALHFSSDLWASLAVLIGLAACGSACGGRIRRPRWWWPCWSASPAGGSAAAPSTPSPTRRRKAPPRRSRPPPPKSPAWSRSSKCARAPSAKRPSSILTVAVSRTLPLDRVSALKDAVAAAIRKQMPGAEPTVTTDPVALNNETVLDRVMVIARNRALAVHHVTVHDLKDRLAISLDLEVGGKLSLREAHALADDLESAIAVELGASVEIDTHIEPLQPHRASGREAPPERVKAVEIALAELAADGRTIRGVHDVRVRETDEGEIVNFHCDVDPALSVQAVHEKVDALERALKQRSPSIKRVIGHAEPMK